MDNNDIIKSLDAYLEKTNFFQHEPSFLEAIGRSHDECIVSSYLGNLLKEECDVLDSLVRLGNPSFSGFGEYEVKLEAFAGDFGRIDILIKGIDSNKRKTILIIENKIDSYERDDQCKNYVDFASKTYPGYERYYVFLCPEYKSIVSLSSDKFTKVTYSTLASLIKDNGSNSKFCLDFITLIKNQLEDIKMDDLDLTLVRNYKIINDRLKRIDDKLDNAFKEFSHEYSRHSKLESELVDGRRTLRFFDKDKWWSGYVDKDDKYYFYIEIKTFDRFDLDIVVQLTIHSYSTNPDTRLNRFISKHLNKDYLGKFVVLRQIRFTSKDDFLSNKWKEGLFDFAFNELDKFKLEMDEIVDAFSLYK